MTEKAPLLSALDEAWSELQDLITSFSDAEMVAPGVVEEWSLKDLLGHMAFWADKAARDLAAVKDGRPDDVKGPGSDKVLNEWNAREAAARQGQPLPGAKQELARAHQAARAALEEFPADKLDLEISGATVFRRFAGDTFAHYKEHVSQIRAWRRDLETTEA